MYVCTRIAQIFIYLNRNSYLIQERAAINSLSFINSRIFPSNSLLHRIVGCNNIEFAQNGRSGIDAKLLRDYNVVV